jgi:hypothetical protein
MCEGSIHVKHRLATGKEHLVVRKIPGLRMKGYYPVPTTADDRLVCIRSTTKAIIKQVRFEPGVPPMLIKAWEGKRNVEVTLRHHHYSDTVWFSDGLSVHLMTLKDGVRIDVGYPAVARKPAGMKVVEGAMREALALPPDPKPEGEDAPSAPADKPEKEPAPAEGETPPTAARRRRRWFARS